MMRFQTIFPVACFAALCALSASPPALAAKKDAQGERMLETFRDWVANWNVQNASFVAMRGGKIIARGQAGDGSPDEPEPVASLSKAVTGVCVAKLIDAKKLKYASTLGKLLPDYFKKNKSADPAAKNITVGELLTQTSGLGYDPTQGTADFAALDFRKKNMAEQLALALERPLSPKTFYYNNINFDALGLVVEAVTGKRYETYCNDTVFKPAGVMGAKLDPTFKILSSYGGWNLTAIEYARFLEHYRPATKLLKSKPASWPKFAFSSGSYYSNGTLLRESQGSYNFWHDGAFYWNETGRPDRNANFGAYFAMWFQNTHFVVTFSPQPGGDSIGDLDYTMYQSAFPSLEASRPPAAPSDQPAAAINGTDRGPTLFATHD